MIVCVILAVSNNGIIGKDGHLPWRIRSDMVRFRKLTTGHHVIMGRRTWEDIGSRPLPGRTCIVLSRQEDFRLEGATVAGSLMEAIALARDADERKVFIIGGSALFEEAFTIADRAYVTQVMADVEGDVSLDLDSCFDGWQYEKIEYLPAGLDDEYPVWFTVLGRKVVRVEKKKKEERTGEMYRWIGMK